MAIRQRGIGGAPPPVVNAGPDVDGSAQDFSACGFVTSGFTNAVVTGGTPPYTYLWEQTGTPAQRGPYSAGSPAAQNTTFADTVCDADNPNFENWRLTVTDDNGKQGSDTIRVELTWVNLS